MNYIRRQYEDKAAVAQITTFTGKGGTTEYQVMLSVTDPMLSFEQQLQCLQQAYVSVVREELADDAVAVFRRYFLSDAANQADMVMAWECEDASCALSVVQQPPLNGTKIALWIWFQTGITLDAGKGGLVGAMRNGYRQYWTGGASNRAANPEYQNRLLLYDYVMQLTEEYCKLATD